MTSASNSELVTFTPGTRTVFLQYLSDNPNTRRVSETEKGTLIEWLTNSHKRPASQEEFSRRNYVRKTFAWEEETQNLLSIAKNAESKDRRVVTEDKIADVVEFVHTTNGHAGWDTTWKDVSTSYYGILRLDVIFLLKRCRICAENPTKRPKGFTVTKVNFPNTAGAQYENAISELLEN